MKLSAPLTEKPGWHPDRPLLERVTIGMIYFALLVVLVGWPVAAVVWFLV